MEINTYIQLFKKEKTVIQNKFFENVTSYHIKQMHVIVEYTVD